jgi:hypothetical protein
MLRFKLEIENLIRMFEMTRLYRHFEHLYHFYCKVLLRGGEICTVESIFSIENIFPINRFLHAEIIWETEHFDSHVRNDEVISSFRTPVSFFIVRYC